MTNIDFTPLTQEMPIHNEEGLNRQPEEVIINQKPTIAEIEPIPVILPKKMAKQGCQLSIDIARSFEEFMMCQTIRAAVYIGEQRCPYEEEFDGNDFTGTHVLARVDGEPVATMRIRWFCNWFKIERMAVLKPFRKFCCGKHDSLGRSITQWCLELARRKGYTLGYGHIQLDLLKYWCCLEGVSEIPGQHFNFSDHAYTCVRIDLAADGAFCKMSDSPMVLNRPEGQWHQPGPLDASTQRAANNTHRGYRR